IGDRRHGAPDELIENLLPTRENLDWAIQYWLGSRIRPGDSVVVSFAGQAVGLPPKPDALPGTPGRDYLLPIDARAAGCDRTGWQLDQALDGLASKGKNTIVCWLDTSLLGRGQPVRKAGADEAKPSGMRLLNKLARWPGVSAWLAADGKVADEGTL